MERKRIVKMLFLVTLMIGIVVNANANDLTILDETLAVTAGSGWGSGGEPKSYGGWYGVSGTITYMGRTGDPTAPPTHTLTWTLPSLSGDYVVFAMWVAGSNRGNDVPWTVTYDGGKTDTVRVDQSVGEISPRAGDTVYDQVTVSLGVYKDPTSVVMGNNATSGYVVADAIAYIKVSDALTIPAASSSEIFNQTVADFEPVSVQNDPKNPWWWSWNPAGLSMLYPAWTVPPAWNQDEAATVTDNNGVNWRCTWSLKPEESGYYLLKAVYTNDTTYDGLSRYGAVAHRITDADGADTVRVDERNPGPADLGIYYLNADSVALVSIMADYYDYATPPGWVIADAIEVVNVCALIGAEVDELLPPDAYYKNHGAYVSRVAQATEHILATEFSELSQEASDEIQSCVVSERAQSDVGKPSTAGKK